MKIIPTMKVVVRKGRSRFLSAAIAGRSCMGRSGATNNCVTSLIVTPTITVPARKVKTNVNRAMIARAMSADLSEISPCTLSTLTVNCAMAKAIEREVHHKRDAEEFREVLAVERESAPEKRAGPVRACAQRARKTRGARGPMVGVFRQRLHDNGGRLFRNLFVLLSERRRRGLYVELHDFLHIAGERRSARQHLVGYHAEAVDVRARV